MFDNVAGSGFSGLATIKARYEICIDCIAYLFYWSILVIQNLKDSCMDILNKPKVMGLLLITSSIFPACWIFVEAWLWIFASLFWLFILMGCICLFVKESYWKRHSGFGILIMLFIAMNLSSTYNILTQ